jgi:hypothetical protein
MDMFGQMDGMFARLFSRMDREFTAGAPHLCGYQIVFRNGGEPPAMEEVPVPEPRATREPVAEVHRIGDETKVITELPGATDDTIRLGVKGSRLVIDAGDACGTPLPHDRRPAPRGCGIDAEIVQKRRTGSYLQEPSGCSGHDRNRHELKSSFFKSPSICTQSILITRESLASGKNGIAITGYQLAVRGMDTHPRRGCTRNTVFFYRRDYYE